MSDMVDAERAEEHPVGPGTSIVTACYNAGEFIEDTIRSVKEQNYPHAEHIIVDGGSTDGTLDIIRKYEGSYNMRWISEPDDNQYDAINKGLRMASGEIVAYQNADDRYAHDRVLERVVREFRDQPEADIIYGDWEVIDEQGNTIPKVRFHYRIPKKFSKFHLVYIANCIPPHSTFLRREVLDDVGFIDHHYNVSGDWDWFIRMALAEKRFHYIPETLSYFRYHLDQKISALRKQAYQEWRELAGKYGASYWVWRFMNDIGFPWTESFLVRYSKLRGLLGR